MLALGVVLLVAAVVAAVIVARGGSAARSGSSPRRTAQRSAPAPAPSGRPSAVSPGATVRAPAPAHPMPPYAVGLRVVQFVDRTRTVQPPDGSSVPRTLRTFVRYPAVGAPGGGDLPGAVPARAAGPFPLVVFGHGFAVTPGLYARLMRAWVRAGYVVAAPAFPLGNANAPGGPDESDLPNQPADMRFVISRMLAADAASSGPLAGLIDPRRIAVSGQSDGGDTALAVAYDSRFRDPRVGAAVILSGAEIPMLSGFTLPSGGPPLLATQGTADTINPPGDTHAFYDAAPSPKYLLTLAGAGHLPPYTYLQPQLGIVERVTTAFLDRYLRDQPGAAQRLSATGAVPGVATLDAHP